MTENDQQPFSEEAALRALEELHEKIEASRVRRKQANEAFDRFLHSFERRPAPMKEPPPAPKTVAPAPAPVPSAPAKPGPSIPLPSASAPVAAPATPLIAAPAVPPAQPPDPEVQYLLLPPPRPTPAPTEIQARQVARAPENIEMPPAFPSELPSEPPDALHLDDWDRTSPFGMEQFPDESRMGTLGERDPLAVQPRSVPAALVADRRPGKRLPLAAGAAGVLVIAVVAFFAYRGKGDDTRQTADPPATETPVAAQPAAQPAPPPVTAPPPRAEISIVRQVWIRVTVDGRKVIERELPPDTRIPLDPASQFIVRAGDAGAVRVAIGGKDLGPVGVDGRVATKTFSVPPKAVQ